MVYLNSLPFLQGVLNIAFALVTIAHLIYYRPFQDKSILLINFVAEINLCIILILVYTYFLDISVSNQQTIEKMVILMVLSSIFFQSIISFFKFLVSLKDLWHKLEKRRALDFVQRFTMITNDLSDDKKE